MGILSRNKNCILVPLAVLGIFVFFLFLLSNHVSATPTNDVADLKKQIEIKNEEIKKLEEEVYLYRREIVLKQQRGKTLKGELNRVDQTIKRLKNDIAVAERKIQKTTLEIKQAGIEIQEKETSIQKLKKGLAQTLQLFFEKDRETPLALLTKYSSLIDFFQQVDHLALAQTSLLNTVTTLHLLKEELEEKRQEEQNKKRELEAFGDSLGDRKKLQEGVRRERDQLLKATKNQEQQYQKILRETEQRQEAILRDIEALEEELRKFVDPSSLPPQRKGALLWPVEGTLTQEYGETPFTKSSRGRHFYQFHNGIDIAADTGTPVKAAEEGMVVATGNTDAYCPRGAYGRYIVIRHPQNLATMYAHLSLIKIARNQKVNRGDVIGYAGSSGLSTGPHLHFTVYDARTVEIRLGKIGTCGLLPFGGSVDPMKYL